jgi:hypothetical protein
MTAEQLIKEWIDDTADHAIIFCSAWTPLSRGIKTACQACGREISAWPLVAAVAKRNPLFHLICRQNCMAIMLRFGPVPYGGAIKENILPAGLEKFS